MNIVITGHVDHGKSTLIGRLLYDTNSIPISLKKEVDTVAEELGRKAQFAYFLDALEEERKQNITIDTTQRFFKFRKRNYVIIDVPGHKEFLRNMITGASYAEAAVLLVDAKEGVQDQTSRHAYILHLLGLKKIIVAVNKMDLVDYDQEVFQNIKIKVTLILNKLHIQPKVFVPISAAYGDNIISLSENTPWNQYTLVSSLERLKENGGVKRNSFRFPVQDVYGDIVVGRVESGKVKKGQEVVILPSKRKTKIQAIKTWNHALSEAKMGECVGVVLKDGLEVERGEVIADESLSITTSFEAKVFWIENVGRLQDNFTIKCATQEVSCKLEKIHIRINSATLQEINDNQLMEETNVGTVTLKTDRPIIIESFTDVEALGRFVLTKEEKVVAAGVVI